MREEPEIYVGMSVDILHHGHINILEKASSYGKVIVGLLTDKAITFGKRLPMLNYENRLKIIEGIKYVSRVVPQEEWDYSNNLKKYKPDFMIHGDDWKTGYMKEFRDNCIKVGFSLIISSQVLDIDSTVCPGCPIKRSKAISLYIFLTLGVSISSNNFAG